MENQSSGASGTGSVRTTPEKIVPRIPLSEEVNEATGKTLIRMNPTRQLGIGGVATPSPQTSRKVFDKRYYIQQINNHIIIIDKETNRMYDQLMHHKLQSTNLEFVEKKVVELSKQFEEKEEYLKILNDVVRLHYLHKGKPIDVSKNITMLRKANKDRMESMEKIQFFDRKDLERVAEKLRIELEQEDHLKKDIIRALSIEEKEELEELTFEKDEMVLEKESMDSELGTLRSDITRFEAKILKDPKMESKYKLRGLIADAPEIAEKYKMEYKDLEAFEKQGKITRMEIETLRTLMEKLDDDMNTDYSDQNRRLAKYLEFKRRERIIENFLQNYSNIARDTFEKLSDLQNKIVYSLEYLSATDEEKDPLWDPEEYEYYVNPNLQKDAVIKIIVKLQKQYVWFRHTLDQFRVEINELLKLKRTYTDEIEIFTNYEDIRDEMIDRQNELATLKTSLTRSLESTSAAIVEANGNRQTVEKKIQHNPAYMLFQELQSKLARLEEKNQKLKDAIDKVVFGAEVGPIKNQCLEDLEEIKGEILKQTEDNSSFMDVVNRQVTEAKIAKETNEPYPINQIRFFKCGTLDPSVYKADLVKKTTPSSMKTTPVENKNDSKETPKKLEKFRYYSDDDDDSSPERSTNTDDTGTSTQTPVTTEEVERKERLSSIKKDLRKEFCSDASKNLTHEHITSVKKDLSKEFEMMSPDKDKSTEPSTSDKTQQKYDIQELYTPESSPQGSKLFCKDSRIKTTVSKEKPQTKQLHRRFSAYGVNIRDQQPESDDLDDIPVEQQPEDDPLPVEDSPEILQIQAACLSPVKEESEKPEETESDSNNSAEIQEEIDEQEDEAKPPSEDSDSEVIKIEFHRSDDDEQQNHENSGEDHQQYDHGKLEDMENPNDGSSTQETPDDPSKVSYKGFTISVKKAQDFRIKSPGSARSSAIDDIVTEFALHSKENSESEKSDDSKHTTADSAKESEIESKTTTRRYSSIKNEDATSSESVSPVDSKTFVMDEHITLIKDEMKEEFGETKLKTRFTQIVKFADQKTSDDDEEEEVEETEVSCDEESSPKQEMSYIEKTKEEEVEETEVSCDEESFPKQEMPYIEKTKEEEVEETEVSCDEEPFPKLEYIEETSGGSSDLQETPPTSPVLVKTSLIDVEEKTPSTSPDLEQTPPLSPTSEKPLITTPEMDTSSSTEMNMSPTKSVDMQHILTTTPAMQNSSESSESTSNSDEQLET